MIMAASPCGIKNTQRIGLLLTSLSIFPPNSNLDPVQLGILNSEIRYEPKRVRPNLNPTGPVPLNSEAFRI
jgi:hypothetical protein